MDLNGVGGFANLFINTNAGQGAPATDGPAAANGVGLGSAGDGPATAGDVSPNASQASGGVNTGMTSRGSSSSPLSAARLEAALQQIESSGGGSDFDAMIRAMVDGASQQRHDALQSRLAARQAASNELLGEAGAMQKEAANLIKSAVTALVVGVVTSAASIVGSIGSAAKQVGNAAKKLEHEAKDIGKKMHSMEKNIEHQFKHLKTDLGKIEQGGQKNFKEAFKELKETLNHEVGIAKKELRQEEKEIKSLAGKLAHFKKQVGEKVATVRNEVREAIDGTKNDATKELSALREDGLDGLKDARKTLKQEAKEQAEKLKSEAREARGKVYEEAWGHLSKGEKGQLKAYAELKVELGRVQKELKADLHGVNAFDGLKHAAELGHKVGESMSNFVESDNKKLQAEEKGHESMEQSYSNKEDLQKTLQEQIGDLVQKVIGFQQAQLEAQSDGMRAFTRA